MRHPVPTATATATATCLDIRRVGSIRSRVQYRLGREATAVLGGIRHLLLLLLLLISPPRIILVPWRELVLVVPDIRPALHRGAGVPRIRTGDGGGDVRRPGLAAAGGHGSTAVPIRPGVDCPVDVTPPHLAEDLPQ